MYFDQKEFGRRVQRLRKETGLTQEQMAEKLHTDRVCIARIEGGSRTCSIEMVVDLAAFFDVSTDHLLLGKPEIKTEKGRLLEVVEELNRVVKNL